MNKDTTTQEKEKEARIKRDEEFIKKIPELAVELNCECWCGIQEEEIQKRLLTAKHGPERYFYEYLHAIIEGLGPKLGLISKFLEIKEGIIDSYAFNEAIYNNIKLAQIFLTPKEVQHTMSKE